MRPFKALLPGVLFVSGWCAAPAGPAPATPFRLDDQLSSATIKASTAASAGRVSEPVVWQDFFSEKDLTWTLVRGQIGTRNGDMMIKGEGSTPVILAPKEPAIDWSLYEAVEIRMSAAGGGEAKIRIGDYEVKQKLGPAGQYQVYRFDVALDAPKGTRPLAVMPTDSLSDLVAIRSIKLLPRAESFPQPAGRSSASMTNIGIPSMFTPRRRFRSTCFPPRAATSTSRSASPPKAHPSGFAFRGRARNPISTAAPSATTKIGPMAMWI